jgi:hypothetical protein
LLPHPTLISAGDDDDDYDDDFMHFILSLYFDYYLFLRDVDYLFSVFKLNGHCYGSTCSPLSVCSSFCGYYLWLFFVVVGFFVDRTWSLGIGVSFLFFSRM